MHKFTIRLSDRSGYNYDLVYDKNGKIYHGWKNSKMLEKWLDGYVPGNARNFVNYVDKNGSGKIKIKPDKFIIPFRENKLNELDWNHDLSRLSGEIDKLFRMAKIKVKKHIPYKRSFRTGDAALYGAFIHVKDKFGDETVLPIEIDKKGIITYAGGPKGWHKLEKIGAVNMSHAKPDDHLKIKTYARSADYLKQFAKLPGFGQSVIYKKEVKESIMNEGPDYDLAKKLQGVDNLILKLLMRYKNKADVDKAARSWMLGLHSKIKKAGVKI